MKLQIKIFLLTFELSDGPWYGVDLLGEFFNLSLWHAAASIHNINSQTLNVSLKQPTDTYVMYMWYTDDVCMGVMYECMRESMRSLHGTRGEHARSMSACVRDTMHGDQ